MAETTTPGSGEEGIAVPRDPSNRPRLPETTIPPVLLDPRGKPASSVKPAAKKPGEPEIKDNFREIVETIVFVVVLVLLLKTFLAEAFVIPTGSMATTLLGYHRESVCRQCGYRYLVNASSEADPQEHRAVPVVSANCPNCGYKNSIREGGPR